MAYIKFQYKLLLLGFSTFVYCSNVYAQQMFDVKVSEEKKEFYLETINSNESLVLFIENTLLNNGLPKMLRNLPLVGSGLNKNAISTSNAGGIWQFTEEYANHYGLKSSDRFDIYHSTQVAMKSLKGLYKKYGNWITVIAAYNCGQGNIDKAMNKANSDRYDKFYSYLSKETIRHVNRFMEACYVTNELNILMIDYRLSAFKIDCKEEEPKIDPALVSTVINSTFCIDIIAEEIDVQVAELSKWNPNIENDLVKEGMAILYLPVDRMPDFLLLKNNILKRSLQRVNLYYE